MGFFQNIISDFKNRDWYKTLDKDTKKEMKNATHSLNDKGTQKQDNLKSWRTLDEQGNEIPLHKSQQEEGLNTNRAEDYTITDSTAIQSVNYNPETQACGVTFKGGNGKEYVYPRVPLEKIDKLLNADSKGGYFSKYITSYSINKR